MKRMPNVYTSERAAAQIDSSSSMPHLQTEQIDDISGVGFAVDPGKLEQCEQPQDIRVLNEFEKEALVDWDEPNDAKNPMNWAPARKWATIALVSSITFVT